MCSPHCCLLTDVGRPLVNVTPPALCRLPFAVCLLTSADPWLTSLLPLFAVCRSFSSAKNHSPLPSASGRQNYQMGQTQCSQVAQVAATWHLCHRWRTAKRPLPSVADGKVTILPLLYLFLIYPSIFTSKMYDIHIYFTKPISMPYEYDHPTNISNQKCKFHHITIVSSIHT